MIKVVSPTLSSTLIIREVHLYPVIHVFVLLVDAPVYIAVIHCGRSVAFEVTWLFTGVT